MGMDRRDAVKKMALLMGGAISAPTLSIILEGCSTDTKKTFSKEFTTAKKEMVERMADLIIPATDTPGAVDAKVPEFIMMMVQETYREEDEEDFHKGLDAFDDLCKDRYDAPFNDLSEENQKEALTELDKMVLGAEKLEDDRLSFYQGFKDLTLLGFFTSETGATETLRYVQTPGGYRACEDYKEGDKAWAS